MCVCLSLPLQPFVGAGSFSPYTQNGSQQVLSSIPTHCRLHHVACVLDSLLKSISRHVVTVYILQKRNRPIFPNHLYLAKPKLIGVCIPNRTMIFNTGWTRNCSHMSLSIFIYNFVDLSHVDMFGTCSYKNVLVSRPHMTCSSHLTTKLPK